MQRYPEVTVNLAREGRCIDPAAEGSGVAIRIAAPDEETTLIDHRIRAVDCLVCASPTWLARAGTPEHPGDLRRHALLHLNFGGRDPAWTFIGPDALITGPVRPLMSANTLEPLLAGACAGLGIANPAGLRHPLGTRRREPDHGAAELETARTHASGDVSTCPPRLASSRNSSGPATVPDVGPNLWHSRRAR